EQKQAIIHRAVTRGLDPNAPLKPSGIPWLGEIPAHWEVKRLKWVTRLQRGYDLPADKRRSGSIPVVSSGGVIDSHCESRVKGPGVVMGRYGSTDAVFYVEEDFWPHNTALFVTDFHGNVPKWCFYLLRTISKSDYSSKSAVPGVDRKDLYEIYVPHPPTDEQVGLIYGIEKQSAAFDAAIKSIEHEVALLREYRTRLIADVVTGKLDVREAARQLPIEADEPESRTEADALDEGEESLDGDVEMIARDAEDGGE
ncbi:MAG: restriction endonuclease subunit S, partial [Blastocatellia bacterium]